MLRIRKSCQLQNVQILVLKELAFPISGAILRDLAALQVTHLQSIVYNLPY
jgi:hypothetical protein